MFTSAVEVLWTARYDYQPEWELAPHQHDYFQLICVLGGEGVISLAGRDYEIVLETFS